jgi:glycerol-3-phosphate cytidylyltransferase-like family protein
MKKYERIYSIGCFDGVFDNNMHDGHKCLLQRMRDMLQPDGLLIIGIHNDNSIEKLKNLTSKDHQPIKIRMNNLKKFVDHVYIIPDTNPTFYLQCMIDSNKYKSSCYVRGNDMMNFPGKKSIENIIDIKYLSYTEGISSTQLRIENRLP